MNEEEKNENERKKKVANKSKCLASFSSHRFALIISSILVSKRKKKIEKNRRVSKHPTAFHGYFRVQIDAVTHSTLTFHFTNKIQNTKQKIAL